jgi:hypothetical protein
VAGVLVQSFEVGAHGGAILSVRTPHVAGSHSRLGVAFTERTQELTAAAHARLALDVLNP